MSLLAAVMGIPRGSRFDFTFALMDATQRGLGTTEAVAAANRALGREKSVEGDLWLWSHEIVAWLERYRDAATPATRGAIRRTINARVNALYGPELCAEDLAWVFKRVDDVCKQFAGRRKPKEYAIAGLYETLNKQLMKTGCDKCPLQTRLWAEDTPAPPPPFEHDDGFPPGDLPPLGAPTEQEAADDALWTGSHE